MVCEDDFHYPFVCVYVREVFHKRKQNKQKKNKWSNYCLLRVRKSFFHILLEREESKLLNYTLNRHGLKKVQKGWLCGILESCSKLLVHDQWNILFTNFFQKLYPPLCIYYRTFLKLPIMHNILDMSRYTVSILKYITTRLYEKFNFYCYLIF